MQSGACLALHWARLGHARRRLSGGCVLLRAAVVRRRRSARVIPLGASYYAPWHARARACARCLLYTSPSPRD
eukprot:8315725-Alexandrium_andersonii.AAC.1